MNIEPLLLGKTYTHIPRSHTDGNFKSWKQLSLVDYFVYKKQTKFRSVKWLWLGCPASKCQNWDVDPESNSAESELLALCSTASTTSCCPPLYVGSRAVPITSYCARHLLLSPSPHTVLVTLCCLSSVCTASYCPCHRVLSLPCMRAEITQSFTLDLIWKMWVKS